MQKDERYLPVGFSVTNGEPVTYVIDYAPEKQAQCSFASENVPQH